MAKLAERAAASDVCFDFDDQFRLDLGVWQRYPFGEVGGPARR